MQSHIQMASTDPFADHLPDVRLERFKTLGQSQMQIEEAMIHAAQAEPQSPTVLFHASLRVTGH